MVAWRLFWSAITGELAAGGVRADWLTVGGVAVGGRQLAGGVGTCWVAGDRIKLLTGRPPDGLIRRPSVRIPSVTMEATAQQKATKHTSDGEIAGEVNQGVKKIVADIVASRRRTRDRIKTQKPKIQ